MTLSLIVAFDEKRAIGKDGSIPWHLPNDLQFFKTMTVGKTTVMGRKTFESVGSKPLPHRTTIVLTSSTDRLHPNIIQTSKPSFVTEFARDKEVMICGGAEVYAQFLPLCDRLYVTRVKKEFGGDTFFPPIDNNRFERISVWKNTYQEDMIMTDYDIEVYRRT